MTIQTKTNIDSGQTEYQIITSSGIQANWDNSLSEYVLSLEMEQVEELYYQLKQVICE